MICSTWFQSNSIFSCQCFATEKFQLINISFICAVPTGEVLWDIDELFPAKEGKQIKESFGLIWGEIKVYTIIFWILRSISCRCTDQCGGLCKRRAVFQHIKHKREYSLRTRHRRTVVQQHRLGSGRQQYRLDQCNYSRAMLLKQWGIEPQMIYFPLYLVSVPLWFLLNNHLYILTLLKRNAQYKR